MQTNILSDTLVTANNTNCYNKSASTLLYKTADIMFQFLYAKINEIKSYSINNDHAVLVECQ